MYDGLTKEMCVASHLMGKQISFLGRKSGWLFVALYLKQCSVCLMSFRSVPLGQIPQSVMSVPVSLTGSRLSRIIPSFHRWEILRGPKGDQLKKLDLSALSKLIWLSKRVSASTFSSIVNLVGSLDSVLEMVSLICEDMKDLFYRYVLGIRTVPLFQGLKFKPTWKALPTL